MVSGELEDHALSEGELSNEERRPDTLRNALMRDQILDTAAHMFDEIGYEKCGIASIAKELNIGRSTIYYYFKGKDEILADLIEKEALEPSLRLEQIATDKDQTPSSRLRSVITDGVVRRLTSGDRFELLARLETQIPKRLLVNYNISRRAIFDFHVRCIKEGIACGEFRDVDCKVTAFAIIGMVNWTLRWYQSSGRLEPQEIAEIIADYALAGLYTSARVQQNQTKARDYVDNMRKDLDAMALLLR
ncbi:TetR/AcrR family transcriptional regulator [Pseudovibrio sp. Ad26]|uniref:TetR/AcrR family transcriptional regulator n=1 Tax=Pseudovibrio sp. Ad26 TaxID=989410 RepID=UPI0007AE441D|nr:TetR/AcrR family transcriptional regulator [Pseudovibrio sp. Ad26]KZL15210.1 Fatty acid metabolism regulator protein [Pseudovibrio sp. Ad26]